MLTKEQIQAVCDFECEDVEVPEWGGMVCIRTMDAGHMDHMQVLFLQAGGIIDATRNPENMKDLKVQLVASTLCDAAGHLLFDDLEGHIVLRGRNGRVIDRLFDVGMRLNKMRYEDVEETKKNSNGLPSDASSIDSV